MDAELILRCMTYPALGRALMHPADEVDSRAVKPARVTENRLFSAADGQQRTPDHDLFVFRPRKQRRPVLAGRRAANSDRPVAESNRSPKPVAPTRPVIADRPVAEPPAKIPTDTHRQPEPALILPSVEPAHVRAAAEKRARAEARLAAQDEQPLFGGIGDDGDNWQNERHLGGTLLED